LDKYFVSRKQFPGQTFPNYVTGHAYVATASAVASVLPLAWRQPLLPLEDVFITGVLAEQACVPRLDVDELEQVGKDLIQANKCNLLKKGTVHMVR
jgi:hypothetical protein